MRDGICRANGEASPQRPDMSGAAWSWRVLAAMVIIAVLLCGAGHARAQRPGSDDLARMLAPTGKLPVVVLMVWYFAAGG
jgi:hypothetical protein